MSIKHKAGEVWWKVIGGYGVVCSRNHFQSGDSEPVKAARRSLGGIHESLPCPQCEELASLREDKARLDLLDEIAVTLEWNGDCGPEVCLAENQEDDTLVPDEPTAFRALIDRVEQFRVDQCDARKDTEDE